MSRRHNNQLPNNLPQLQNLIKRDPESYKEEFNQQWAHFQASLEIYLLRSSEYSKDLDELLLFLAQIAHCYPTELNGYPQLLMSTLEKYCTVLEPNIRMSMCRSLILMRNKNLLEPTTLLSLFFKLLHCPDKNLRKALESHIMIDIKNVNKKHKNHKLNTVLQNFMFTMIRDGNSARAAKTSLNIMIELYRKNVWNDAKTVNVIASACSSKVTKLMVTAIQFFLTNESKNNKDGSDSDSDNDDNNVPTAKEVLMANRFNKKTRKRDKNLTKVKSIIKKKKNKEKVPTFNFSALHLLHDPQGMVERLFKQLESMNERYEVKLMTMDLISRLIGIHQLILLNFYPYIKRFLQPHQRDVTKILQFVAQSAHELIPPDILESVLQTLVNNFVTERNSGEVMAVGINAIREICARCPLVMSRELLHDLAQYKSYREKSVMMASRSLIHLFRDVNPNLLHKRDKGKPTLATLEKQALQYGESKAKDHVPGAEVLLAQDDDNKSDNDDSGNDSDLEENSDSDGSWVDVSHSEDENVDEEVGEEEDDEKTVGKNKSEIKESGIKSGTSMDPNERRRLAAEVSIGKILTDEDFKKIETMQLQKEIIGAKKGSAKKRKAVDTSETTTSSGELVDLSAIEMVHKKRRHDRDSRLETVMKGREGREKFTKAKGRMNPFASTTDKEKRKKKPFMMIRSKLKNKQKKSFKERQAALRHSLMKQKKMS